MARLASQLTLGDPPSLPPPSAGITGSHHAHLAVLIGSGDLSSTVAFKLGLKSISTEPIPQPQISIYYFARKYLFPDFSFLADKTNKQQ